MKEISSRALNLGTENAFVVLKEVNDLKAKGKDIVNFCIGQPDFPTPKNICDAAVKAIYDGKTGYTPSPGIPELRKAVAEYISRTRHIKVDPEWVIIAGGGKPFIGYTIFCVTEYGKGDEVIYPNPGYPIYESQIRAQGAVPVALPLLERKNFNFDIDMLRKLVTPRTKLLILNSPHNPTGGVLSREELEEIADICIKNDIWVFSDEIYSQLVYEGEFNSIASIDGMLERTIIMDGVSKTFSMTGWRIGYSVNPHLAKYFSTLVTNTESCAGHPNQYAALEALTGPQDDVKKMFETFKKRRDLIVEGLNRIDGIKCLKPGGAFYVWPNVTEACKMIGAEDSEVFRKRLLYEAGVAVLSDIHFGFRVEGEGFHLRFSYASSFDEINEGLNRIEDFIKKNKK